MGIAWIYFLIFPTKPLYQTSFNQPKWKSYSGNEHSLRKNPRGRMFNDLKERLLLEKPDKSIIISLLGDPDCGIRDNELAYYLGGWTNPRIDPDCIHIILDESKKVSDIKWLQH